VGKSSRSKFNHGLVIGEFIDFPAFDEEMEKSGRGLGRNFDQVRYWGPAIEEAPRSSASRGDVVSNDRPEAGPGAVACPQLAKADKRLF
jgi:hypothetical protein